jgi:hypothetical protein
MCALILRADGTRKAIQPTNGTTFSLPELQAIVGAGAPPGCHWIEIVPTKDGRIMVINEEGKLCGLPRNAQATALVDLPTPADLAQAKAMFGDALIVVSDDLESEEADSIVGDVLVCEDYEVQ